MPRSFCSRNSKAASNGVTLILIIITKPGKKIKKKKTNRSWRRWRGTNLGSNLEERTHTRWVPLAFPQRTPSSDHGVKSRNQAETPVSLDGGHKAQVKADQEVQNLRTEIQRKKRSKIRVVHPSDYHLDSRHIKQ